MTGVVSAEVQRVRRLIDGLRRDRRSHPQHGRRDYSQRARQVGAACAELIETEPAAVPALTRRAVERVTAALMHLDDSSGAVGGDLRDLMDLHARACAAAPPNPKRLAAWLVTMRLDGPGWPDFELRDFAPALGETGRAELARLVDERSATAQPDALGRTPFGVGILLEQLAEISGDVDHYIAVLDQDLDAAPQYVKIVDALRKAGRAGEAEEWAYRGLSELGNPVVLGKLRDTYVELLLDRGARETALAVRHEVFARNPTRPHFADLRRTAESTGDWTQLRDAAIQRLRGATSKQPAFADHLIDVLLDEDEPEEAWRVACEHAEMLFESRWQHLIDVRQPSHPADVIAPLQRLIEQRLAYSGDKYRYAKSIRLIRQLREACRTAGEDQQFAEYLADLRERHQRKTAFLAKLDHTQL